MRNMSLFVAIMFLLTMNVTPVMAGDKGAKTPDIEYLNTELDGSVTLRVWGEGKNKRDAIEQAKKNAVNEVLFFGIKGGPDSLLRPLLCEVNAREKYSEYFDAFFKDKGTYSDFISMKDQKRRSKEKIDGELQVIYGITVRVLIPQLKQKLAEDKIIKNK